MSKTRTKIDLKKEEKEYYNPPKNKVSVVDVPERLYFMIDGQGNPSTSEDYANAISCLYGVSYALKMKIVKKETDMDFVVPPLEGLWWHDDYKNFDWNDQARRGEWKWTSLIRIPDFVTKEQIERAIELIKEKEYEAFPKLRYEKYIEGKAVQIMHIGPYADEGPNIEKIHNYAYEQGWKLRGKHHEIYLSDPRRAAPDKMKTVIRQPVS